MAAVRAARRQSVLASQATELVPPLERTMARFVDVLHALHEERRSEIKSLREAHTALLLETRQERAQVRALEERVAGLTWVLLAALAVLLILGYVALTASTAPIAHAAHVYTSVNATQAAAAGGVY